MGSGVAVTHLPLEQEFEGPNPSSPAMKYAFPVSQEFFLMTGTLNFMASQFKMYYVYILLSLKDNLQYIGYTDNIKRRLSEHTNGKNFSTKFRRPFKLIFFEGFLNQKDALRREKYFKTNPGKRTIKLMLREYFKESKL